MIILKSKLKSFNLATSFQDLSFKDYQEIVNPNTSEFRQIQLLTGLNEIEASVLDLSLLSEHILFLVENPFESIEPSNFITLNGKEILLPKEIGEKQWAQKITASDALIESDALRVLSTYVQPLYDESEFDLDRLEEIEILLSLLSVEELFSGANFIKDQLNEIFIRERNLLKADLSFEQLRAGIDMFNQLGDQNTIDLIAQGKVWKYDTVLKIDYNTILIKLFKLNLTAKFEKNYNEIMKTAQS